MRDIIEEYGELILEFIIMLFFVGLMAYVFKSVTLIC